MDKNQKILDSELSKIRNLDDFDLVMLISEVHDHGWGVARRTLKMMPEGQARPREKRGQRKNAAKG